MSSIKRVDTEEPVHLGIGHIMVCSTAGEPVWEVGQVGEGCFGFYRSTPNGRLWWPIYFDTLDQAEQSLRSVAKTYGWTISTRK